MAPEIIGRESYGILVDMWALAVLLYFMLFTEYPFQGKYLFMQVTIWSLKFNENAVHILIFKNQ